MLDVPTFQATYPEFLRTPSRLIEATLARACRMVSPRVWCGQTDDGVGLLTAHWLRQMAPGTSTATEEATAPKGSDDYDATPYGRMFKALRDSIVGAYPGGGTW